MRAIKFRGKTVNNGEWVEGNLLSINNHYEIGWQESSTYEEEGGWYQEEVQSDTIGQFTGLHDKDGKEIYEGDILQTRANFIGVVRWNNKGYFYLNDDKEQKEKFCENLGIMLNYAQFEIIGTYFDNPELLKRSEQ